MQMPSQIVVILVIPYEILQVQIELVVLNNELKVVQKEGEEDY